MRRDYGRTSGPMVESGVLTPVIATKRHFQLGVIYNEQRNIIAQNGRKVNKQAYFSRFIAL